MFVRVKRSFLILRAGSGLATFLSFPEICQIASFEQKVAQFFKKINLTCLKDFLVGFMLESPQTTLM